MPVGLVGLRTHSCSEGFALSCGFTGETAGEPGVCAAPGGLQSRARCQLARGRRRTGPWGEDLASGEVTWLWRHLRRSGGVCVGSRLASQLADKTPRGQPSRESLSSHVLFFKCPQAPDKPQANVACLGRGTSCYPQLRLSAAGRGTLRGPEERDLPWGPVLKVDGKTDADSQAPRSHGWKLQRPARVAWLPQWACTA